MELVLVIQICVLIGPGMEGCREERLSIRPGTTMEECERSGRRDAQRYVLEHHGPVGVRVAGYHCELAGHDI